MRRTRFAKITTCFVSAAIILSLFACEPVIPNTSAPPMSTAQIPDDNQILAMILTQQLEGSSRYWFVAPKTDDFLLENFTKEGLAKQLNKGDYDFTNLADLFLELNRESIPLTLSSSPEHGYVIDYEDKYHQYSHNNPVIFWEQWHKDNPEAIGHMFISIPAIDPNTGYILVYVIKGTGATAGIGNILAYKYSDSKLIQIGTVQVFIS